MKRVVAILMFLLALGLVTQAQVDYSFGNMKKSRKLKNIPYVGIKGGMTFYNMRFSNKVFNDLAGERIVSPGYGVFFELPIQKKRGWSVGGELMMIERGMKKTFTHLGVQEINQINSKYIDLKLPVTYYFLVSDYFNPYVFCAADIAFCYG